MFHVLLALADGERYGYAIMQEVESRTDGEVQLPPGTLYRTIKLLLQAGLIERRSPEREKTEHDTRRVYYRITRSGRGAAVAEASRLAKIVVMLRPSPPSVMNSGFNVSAAVTMFLADR
jgi:DNA-binding PadR family transcriptional regulator